MGLEAYARFWILNELLIEQNLGRDKMTDTLVINEHTLAQELRTNKRFIGHYIDNMKATSVISATKVTAKSGNIAYNIWHITLPKSLIYIRSPRLKSDNKKRIDKNRIEKKEKVYTTNWKTDYKIYLKDLEKAYTELDEKFYNDQEKYYPNLNLQLTIEKAYHNYWHTEAGWKNKKGKRSNTIDWRATFRNALGQKGNHVYKDREDMDLINFRREMANDDA
jgi:hypothetical protein